MYQQVAYQRELPPHPSRVHDVFHVSQLRRCFKDPSAKSTMKRLIYKMTFLIENTLLVFLIPRSVSLAERRSSFWKFSGRTTPRKKPRGKEKTVSVPSTPPSSRRLLNLGTRFFWVGASCHNPLLRFVPSLDSMHHEKEIAKGNGIRVKEKP